MKPQLFSFGNIPEDLQRVDLPEPGPDSGFDRMTRIAMRVFQVPIAIVSVIDSNGQWLKSCQGLSVADLKRDDSLCTHTISGNDLLYVPDTLKDERFANQRLVREEPHIRFYAGYPLSSGNVNVGTFCIMDCRPRELSAEDQQLMQDLASWAALELIRVKRLERVVENATTDLKQSEEAFFKILETLPVGVFVIEPDGKPFYANQTAKQILGRGIAAQAGPEKLAETYKVYVMGTDEEYPMERMPIVRALEGISSEVQNMDIHKPDGILTMEVWGTPVFKDGQIVYAVAAFQDITERIQMERRLKISHALNDVLYQRYENPSAEILRVIGEGLNWDIGIQWKVDSSAGVLKCAEIWTSSDSNVKEFEMLSRKLCFDPGPGLPGRVWAKNEPLWILDVAESREFPRIPAALKNGLHTGFGFPIRAGTEIIGVMEFFSRHKHRIDKNLVSMLGSPDSRFNQLIAVKIAEDTAQ
jgi:PAS domain S-box-containing protein